MTNNPDPGLTSKAIYTPRQPVLHDDKPAAQPPGSEFSLSPAEQPPA
jgi:hypothetical protein